MKIYNVGPDELCDYEVGQITADQFKWLVYFYEIGDYCGDGEAVAMGKDGLLYYTSLSHCSCYGPMESWPDRKITVTEFLRPKDSVHDYCFKEEVNKQVRALVRRIKVADRT